MSEELELALKAILGALAVIAVIHRRRQSIRPERVGPWLAILAALSAFAWIDFGTFHGHNRIHHWEDFHYVLGARYFDELGYDSLYAASIAAQRELPGRQTPNENVRDLRTNELVPLAEIEDHMTEIRARFTDARWAQFVADNRYFVGAVSSDFMNRWRIDHGYNPPPSWTLEAQQVIRLIVGEGEDGTIDADKLKLLGLVDLALIAGAFLLLFRTFGARVAAISLIVFGVGYPWRFYWVGGACLRWDWFFFTIAGVCAFRKERWLLGGALIGYATTLRVFPILFLFGPFIAFLREAYHRRSVAWAFQLGFGLFGAIGLTFWLSLEVGGTDAWRAFFENIELHQHTWITNNLGLKHVLFYGPDTYNRALINPELADSWAPWQDHMASLQADWGWALRLAQVALLAILGAAAYRATPAESAVLGPAVVFTLTSATCYYWCMLCLVPLYRRGHATVGVLLLSVVSIIVTTIAATVEQIYGPMAYMLLAIILVWAGPDAYRTFVERRPVDEGERTPGAADGLNPEMA